RPSNGATDSDVVAPTRRLRNDVARSRVDGTAQSRTMLPSRRFSGAPQTTALPAAAGPDRSHRTHRAREKPQAARGACHGQSTPTRLVREGSERLAAGAGGVAHPRNRRLLAVTRLAVVAHAGWEDRRELRELIVRHRRQRGGVV